MFQFKLPTDRLDALRFNLQPQHLGLVLLFARGHEIL